MRYLFENDLGIHYFSKKKNHFANMSQTERILRNISKIVNRKRVGSSNSSHLRHAFFSDQSDPTHLSSQHNVYP